MPVQRNSQRTNTPQRLEGEAPAPGVPGGIASPSAGAVGHGGWSAGRRLPVGQMSEQLRSREVGHHEGLSLDGNPGVRYWLGAGLAAGFRELLSGPPSGRGA